MEYSLIRTRRRSIGLTVTRDAKLIVHAPTRTPVHEIERILTTKERWISRKLAFFRSRPAVQPKQIKDGEEFLFLGDIFTLKIAENPPKPVQIADKTLIISQATAKHAARRIPYWYRTEALAWIRQRVDYYADLCGLTYKSVKVGNARTRWGSCGHQGGLNFTWRLIMAPKRVVDYVVVHELMHLKQPNHSPRFWHEVGLIVPDYKADERWLKDFGHQLSLVIEG